MKNLTDKLTNKILKETYEDKVKEVKEKLNFKPGKSFDYVEEEGEVCECGGEMREGECMECGKMYENIDETKNEIPTDLTETSDDDEVEEGNAFSGALANAKKEGKKTFDVDGKKYPVKESVYYQFNYKGKEVLLSESNFGKFVRKIANKKENNEILFQIGEHTFTEEKLIDIIEEIVLKEEKKFNAGKPPKGYSEYERSVKTSKKENDDYIVSVAKKMKDYLKDGSKGNYEPNPKHFPKGNGQLEKMKTKKYTMSDDGKEFLDDYMHPGMENLVPDEIQYDEKWVKDNIEGSSKTGNNPKWANAEETELGEKISKKMKEKKYNKAKMAAYRKSKQPITDGPGEMSGGGVDIKLENVESKNNQLSEEFDRMKKLISYDRVTQ